MSEQTHIPVMLEAVTKALAVQDGEYYIDGTFGNGGYSKAVLAQAKCQVLGIDRDPGVSEAAHKLAESHSGFSFTAGRFSQIEAIAQDYNGGNIHGIMLDIGVSSMQLDQASRGFSFMRDGPLDMRMSQTGLSAQQIIETFSEKQIADILYYYGEERQSRRIARQICADRRSSTINTTAHLASIVEKVCKPTPKRTVHPATRTFQALRIYVNDELGELVAALNAAERLLLAGGRLIVVSFHSLEDRIVKAFFRARAAVRGTQSRFVPNTEPLAPTFLLPKTPLSKPMESEIGQNIRARSARLRSGIRTDSPTQPDFTPNGTLTNTQLHASWA